MTHANTRTICGISRESYGTEHYEGPYLLNHTEKALTEGGSTIILVASMPDRDQDEASSVEGSGALSSKISISDDRRGDIEIKSTYTRDSTKTALFMASLHERDKQRKARLERCYDVMSRPEREEYVRQILIEQQAIQNGNALYERLIASGLENEAKRSKPNSSSIRYSDEIRGSPLNQAIDAAEKELPEAFKMDDKMKASVMTQPLHQSRGS